ncbi:hypothetical protein [Salipiger sp.]|uniref:hypothetical protein n=1 Tax=Salipiger sp. TaxID=2078585 RepID=UPI003A986585
MARSLRFWLEAPEASQLDPGDVPMVLGVVLVRAARSGLCAMLSDPRVLDMILSHHHHLTAREAAEMRLTCEWLERHAPDTQRLALVLQGAVAYGDRLALALCLREAVRSGQVGGPDGAALLALAEATLGIREQDLAEPHRFA